MSIAATNVMRRRLKAYNWHRMLHSLLSRSKNKQCHLAALETLKQIYRITQATQENDSTTKTKHQQVYKIAWIPRPKFTLQGATTTSTTNIKATTKQDVNQKLHQQSQSQPPESFIQERQGIEELDKWRAMALVKASEIKTYELHVLLYNFAATHAARMDEETLCKFIQMLDYCKYNEPKMLLQLSGREIPQEFLLGNQAYNMLLRHISPQHPALGTQCQISQ